MTIKYIILAILIVALSIGFLFEEPIAKWERKTAKKIADKFTK